MVDVDVVAALDRRSADFRRPRPETGGVRGQSSLTGRDMLRRGAGELP
jgi:hypothetical protein